MALSTTVHDLRRLIRSSRPLVVIETGEEARVLALLIQDGRLLQKTRLTTDLLIEELTRTILLSVTRQKDIEALRQTAEWRFASVR